ncbi:MAG: hypothetical protein A2898_01085 [Candidatus Kerfeldbacteria bacterium RIFCSPLOWO2_01_FULL_48_11]|uniref:DUF5671 domain-containing protein n=1 Tax=Candidatus Kerfeldbacteria bacterium RIFCSPLOWO2_01_FULL_48_11 TaxID=1798543 RepID=A0A1G2B687_9BACT|nr:MAG: hypothetical protein A2898_01085 [Candidatus Kerfeldbacteria bacterium RIFCSPLOWO2_01_FULL_48_11]
MEDDSLREWVAKAHAKGLPDDEIVRDVTQKGWKEPEIRKALKAHKGGLSVVDSPSEPMTGNLFLRAWQIVKSRWKLLAGIALIQALIITGVQLLITATSASFSSFLLYTTLLVLMVFFCTLSLTHTVSRVTEGSVSAVAHATIKTYGFYIWTAVLGVLATLGGLVAFVMPGIILSIMLIPLPFVVVEEKVHGMAALKRCFALTRDFRWDTFLKILVLGLAFLAVFIVLFLIIFAMWFAVSASRGAALSLGGFLAGEIGFLVIQAILYLLLPAFSQAYYAVIYRDLSAIHPRENDPEPIIRQGKKIMLGFMIAGMVFAIPLSISVGFLASTGVYDEFLNYGKITQESVRIEREYYNYLVSNTEELITDEADRNDIVRSINIIGLQVSLQDYYLKNSVYPATLDELIPTFLPEMLVDPATGESYGYALSENGKGWELCTIFDTDGLQCVTWP